MKHIKIYSSLFIFCFFTSCIEVEETFYINPDGSMKVDIKMTKPQMMFGNKSKDTSEEKLKKFALKTIKETANAYEAISNVKYALNEDDLKTVSYTAYYKSYNDYQNDKSNMILPEMEILPGGILSFKNNADPSKGLSMSKKMPMVKIEPKKLSEAELAEEIKKSKKESQMAKQMLPMVLGNMYVKKTFIFNGKIKSSSNVQTSGPATVTIEFDGKKTIGTIMEIFEDEAFIEASVKEKHGIKTEVPPADIMRKKMFGNTKPMSFEIKSKGSNLFDYEKEKKKAIDGMSVLLKSLGEEYYENKKYEIIEGGKLIEEGNYKFGLKDGNWKEYHDNGKTKSESTYKQNKEHGTLKEWSYDGVLTYEGSYADDKKHGKYKEWYDNGTPKEEGEYNDGKRNGQKLSWYKNGNPKWELNHLNGKTSGLQKNWYEAGQIKKEYGKKNGMYDGICREWHENGQLMEEKKYVDGSLEDTLKAWNREGVLAELTVYKNDEIQGVSKRWWEDGIKREETTYVNGKKDGLCKNWSIDGKDSMQVVYKNNEVWEGKEKNWFGGKRLRSESTYKDGKLHGVSKTYHWSGSKIAKEELYENGKLIKTKEYDKDGGLINEK